MLLQRFLLDAAREDFAAAADPEEAQLEFAARWFRRAYLEETAGRLAAVHALARHLTPAAFAALHDALAALELPGPRRHCAPARAVRDVLEVEAVPLALMDRLFLLCHASRQPEAVLLPELELLLLALAQYRLAPLLECLFAAWGEALPRVAHRLLPRRRLLFFLDLLGSEVGEALLTREDWLAAVVAAEGVRASVASDAEGVSLEQVRAIIACTSPTTRSREGPRFPHLSAQDAWDREQPPS
jgi:hypothetical protein